MSSLLFASMYCDRSTDEERGVRRGEQHLTDPGQQGDREQLLERHRPQPARDGQAGQHRGPQQVGGDQQPLLVYPLLDPGPDQQR
ncbi:MAG: hypothetical protein DLM59_15135 [Pseudonocardiales bacterium]|nr:MAG: hypothetical protein DLM59_15135 [Pseudonocardiales bacterium]